MRTFIIVYYAVIACGILISQLPVGKSLLSIHKGGVGVKVFCHAAHDLWWLFTVYVNGWGIEIFATPKPYWPITVGFTRSVGFRVWRVSCLLYLGKLGCEVVVRTPPQTWYDVRV